MSSQNLEINKNSYVAFDATSLRDLIIARLNKENVFTDQNYVGSNISSIIEIISYSFSTLMFYLNKTSTESMFTESLLYENMNRIVKMLDYNPMGCQTASVSFNLAVQNMVAGSYAIPRYSYVTVAGSVYSFATDVAFTKTTNNTLETIDNISNRYRLYQGRYIEYPEYTASGATNELVVLSVDDKTIIDHLNIDVYVKDSVTHIWSKWSKVDNLFSYTAQESVYEIRLNEYKRYEIKFGDNINGKKLNEADIVSIFYISSLGSDGEIGAGSLSNTIISKFNSPNYELILADTPQGYTESLADNNYSNLFISNDYASTPFSTYESVDEIRKRAPKIHRTQGRLVAEQDYISFISSNFYNIIADVAVKNNEEYLSTYIKYLFDIGISSPQLESRVLYNQVNFANSCNFNNIYIFALPKTQNRTYLMPSQKEAIIESIAPYKVITSDIVISDPIYMAVDVAVKSSSTISLKDIDNTEIYVEINKLNRRGINAIQSDIRDIFVNYFNTQSSVLGSTINLYQIYTDILNVDGIVKVTTRRTDTGAAVEGLSIIVWNPVYLSDITITSQNISLPYFKCAYLNNIDNLMKKFKFSTSSVSLQNINI